MALISVTQFAQKHSQDTGRVRRLIAQGRIPAQKIGSQWVIEEETPWPQDQRIKSGQYKDWRKKYPGKQAEEPSV